jgi:hypothetical protein
LAEKEENPILTKQTPQDSERENAQEKKKN